MNVSMLRVIINIKNRLYNFYYQEKLNKFLINLKGGRILIYENKVQKIRIKRKFI